MNRKKTETAPGSFMQSYEERRKKVNKFQMTSDIFFGKVLEDKEACQEVVRILLDDERIVVKSVKIQYAIRNLENRSVVLDVMAEAADGRLMEIEMQVSDQGDHQKRVRYYVSSIDMSFLEKGVPYAALPDIYTIYITEKDVFRRGCGLYHIDRVMREKNERIDNGVHEIYANLEHPSGDKKIDELLSYLKRSDSHYETKTFPNVVKRVTYLKEKKEGIEVMCKILEEERAAGREEGIQEGKKEGIEEGFKEGRKEGIKAIIFDNLEEGKSKEQIIEKLTKRFLLKREEAERYYHNYVK